MSCRSCGAKQPPQHSDSCLKCGADLTEVTISGITHLPKPSWQLPATLVVLAAAVAGGAWVFIGGLGSRAQKPSVDITLPAVAPPQIPAPEAGWLSGMEGLAKAVAARRANEAPIVILFCGPKKSCAKAEPFLSDGSLKPLFDRVYKVKLNPGQSKQEQAFAAEHKTTSVPGFVFLGAGKALGDPLPLESAVALAAVLESKVAEASKELVARAGAELAAQQQDRALATLEAAIALDPKSADAHHWRGLTLEAKGDLKAAAANFKAALERNPDHLSALEHLGYAYLELGATKEALATLDALVNKAPSYERGRGLHLRALARARAGDRQGAREDLQVACTLGTAAACAKAR